MVILLARTEDGQQYYLEVLSQYSNDKRSFEHSNPLEAFLIS